MVAISHIHTTGDESIIVPGSDSIECVNISPVDWTYDTPTHPLVLF